jgi:signal transduction histidine kinase/DNA repair protein RadC
VRDFSVPGTLRKSYRGKIFASTCLLVFVISAAFTLIFYQYQTASLRAAMIERGLSLAELASENSKLGTFSRNPRFLNSVSEGILRQEGALSFVVYSPEGEEIYRRGLPKIVNPVDHRGVIREILEKQTSAYREKSDHFEFWAAIRSSSSLSSQEDIFFVKGQGNKADSVIGFVEVDISQDALNRHLSDLLKRAAVIFVVSLLLGTGFAFIIAKGITKPLVALQRGVEEVGRGNLSQFIAEDSEDEIGRLASTFNSMTELLRKREKEKRELSDQLSQSERLKALGTFVAGISHDFNNILSIIQMNLELGQAKAPGYMEGYITRSVKAAQRGSDLVKKLLSFSHENPIARHPVNLELLVQETVDLFEESLRGIRVNMNCSQGYTVRGDVGQIQQAIINLLSNARDAIQERSTQEPAAPEGLIEIAIEIAEDGGTRTEMMGGPFIRLAIKDNGCGMDAHTKQHIFEPFFTRKRIGTGLGLSTVYGIMKQHGGWIEVFSEEGKGSRFDLYFHPYGQSLLEPEKACGVHEVQGGSETLLLVDDEEDALIAAKEKLEELGYRVLTANGGERALKILKSEPVDLVLLDYVMPDISGLEVYRHIKEKNPHVKVIMQSGKDVGHFPSSYGKVEVIRKPFSLDALTSKLRASLGRDSEFSSFKSSINRVRYYLRDERTVPYKDEIVDIKTVYKLFQHIADEPSEQFIVVFLSGKKRIIAYDKLSTGTINKVVVYPREVVKGALLTNAVSVILVHNHPSGDLNPSENDIVVSASIAQACQTVDVELFDHVIIGKDDYYSFAENGDL